MIREALGNLQWRVSCRLPARRIRRKVRIPRELIDEIAGIGYFGILIPAVHGGLGLGAYEYCLVAEQHSRGWMSVGSLIARGNRMIGALAGPPPQKKANYLPRVARSMFLGAFSLSEPNADSDLANCSCRALPDGDEWVIFGDKYWYIGHAAG